MKAVALAALVAAAALGTARTAAAQSDDPGAGAASEVLAVAEAAGPWATASRAEALGALVALGPEGVPACVDYLLGRLDSDEEGADEEGPDATVEDRSVQPDWAGPELVRAALERQPAVLIERAVAEAIDADSALGERGVAAGLLGERGDADSLALLLTIYGDVPPVHMSRPFVRAGLVDALTAILVRDPKASHELALRCGSISPAVAGAIVQAVAGHGGRTALETITRLLGRDAGLDEACLEALATIELYDPLLHDRAVKLARSHLDHPDPNLRRRGAIAAGALADGEAAEQLLDLLEEQDLQVQGGALAALQQLAQTTWGADAEHWRRWLDRELEWSREKLPELESALTAEDDVAALAAMRELALHPLFRRRVARSIGALLPRSSGPRAKAAVDLLIRLDEPEAWRHLWGAHKHPDPDARAAVRAALSARQPPAFAAR